jgi:hypothetical protein
MTKSQDRAITKIQSLLVRLANCQDMACAWEVMLEILTVVKDVFKKPPNPKRGGRGGGRVAAALS